MYSTVVFEKKETATMFFLEKPSLVTMSYSRQETDGSFDNADIALSLNCQKGHFAVTKLITIDCEVGTPINKFFLGFIHCHLYVVRNH